MAIVLTTTVTTLLDPPFWFHRKLKSSVAEKYLDSREIRLHNKTLRIQSSCFKFRFQNLRRHNHTGEFIFRIRPRVCKLNGKTINPVLHSFRIRHESGTISPCVNPVSETVSTRDVVVYILARSSYIPRDYIPNSILNQ